MQLIETSTEIIFDPDPVDGALNQGALTWTKGKLGGYGSKARFFYAQCTDDNELTFHRISDVKGTPGSEVSFAISTYRNFASSLIYPTRCTTNRTCNVFSNGNQWSLIQVSFESQTKIRDNPITRPDAAVTTGYVKTFSRYKRHLYLLVVNDDSSETIHRIPLNEFNSTELIYSVDSMSAVAGQTDILAGEEYLYVADGTDIKLYLHGNMISPDFTWSSVYTADTYDDYPVQMLEIDSFDVLVRKKGTQLYRIIGGSDPRILLLSDTLDEDLSQFRINSRGYIYVEGAEFDQTAGDYDEHVDKWYLLNDTLTLETYLSGVVVEVLTDCGISEDDIDVSELTETCRGFRIQGQTQIQILQELMILYDFSLPVIDGKVYAKKITTDTTATAISSSKIGMGLNNPPQTVFTITEKIADTDYPKQVTVKFTDADDNYKESAFVLRAQDSNSSDVQNIDLSNHSLSDSIAQTLAHNLFKKWYTEKGFWSFTASVYYLEELQPGELITVSYENESYTLKVISVTVRDILIDVTCVKNYI